MDERLKEAFGQVRAEDSLKAATRARLAAARAGRKRSAPRYWLAAAVACLALLVAGIGGYQFYFTPTTILSIDINPSLELGVNRFDKVVTVQGWNEDGQALADSLELRFLDYQEALGVLIGCRSIADRLAQGQLLSITVVGEDQVQSDRLLAGAEACTAGQENVRCGHGDAQTLEEAHHAGLSMGKYQAFLELQALDPNVAPEDVAGLTMRQIRDWIDRLAGSQGAEETPVSTPGGGWQGDHDGGQGHHHGWDTHE